MAPSSPSPRPRGRIVRLLATGGVALLLIGLIGLGTAALHLRASAEAPASERAPVPVEVVRAERVDGHVVEQRFAGRLEPAREADLAFEQPGLVVRVTVEEGDEVRAGAVVARLDPDRLEAERDRLRAERAATAADLELARLTEARQKDLTGKGFSSAQRYDEARLAVQALEARLEQIGAAIRAVEIDLGKTELRAPFAGSIAARMADEGAVVAAGQPVVQLIESGRPRARIGLSPQAAASLERSATYRIVAAGQGIEATLVAVNPDLATTTRTVPVLFEVADPGDARFGDVVELVLERTVGGQGFWLPRSALSEGRKGLFEVYTVVRDGDRALIGREAVEVVHAAGDRVFVRGTLTDGVEVVARGPHRVIPGQTVEVLTAGGTS